LRDGLVERAGESLFELQAFTTEYLSRLVVKPQVRNVEIAPAVARTAVAAVAQAAKSTGGRKSTWVSKIEDRICLRLQWVEGLSTSVPNKFIAIHAGRQVQISPDIQRTVFASLTPEQRRKVQGMNVAIDFVARKGKQPSLLVNVISAQYGVSVNGETLKEGNMRTCAIGEKISFAEIISFRVAGMKF
jgi:hypothetical protein